MAYKRRRRPIDTQTDQKRRKTSDTEGQEIQEKIRVDGEIKRRENKYYLMLSERYRIAGFVFFLAFVLFCGVMMVRNSEYITYDNFIYLIRDFDSMGSGNDTSADEISLDISEASSVRSFRGGFAVASNDSVTVYDSTGVVLLSESERFSYPALAVSDKYIIAYDIGGKTYSVYNSVTRIISKKTEFPIVCASVCDDGSFIVTTESDEAKYVVDVYNTALQNTMNIYKDKYVTSAAISSDGKWVATASLAESGADFACEVSFYKIGESTAEKTVLYTMAMPLLVEGLEGGNFVLLCDDAVRFFTCSGELLSETVIGGNGISDFHTDGHGVLLVRRENSIGTKNRVFAFNTAGNILYNSAIDSRITGAYVALEDSSCEGYVIADGDVICLMSEENVTHSFEGDVKRIIEMRSGVYAYSDGKAVRIGEKK